MVYIGWRNLLPLGSTASFTIYTSAARPSGQAGISPPYDSLSDENNSQEATFRQLIRNQLNFELESSYLRTADSVGVSVRFKDDLPADGRLLLGARNKAGQNYLWKEAYVPFYEELKGLPLVASTQSFQIYATAGNSKSDVRSVDDFLQDLPFGSVIASNNRDFSPDRGIGPEQSKEIDAAEFPADSVRIPPVSGPGASSNLDLDISLRGPHEFYFFSGGGPLELTVTKRDLNWYAGEDKLDVLVYALDGTLEGMAAIEDDGDATGSRQPGEPQQQTLKVDSLEKGIYNLALRSTDRGGDFVVTRLEINQGKLVAPRKVFLAGDYYFSGEPGLISVWCFLFQDSEISFSTPHKAALQKVYISGEGDYQTLDINEINTRISSGLLKAGLYQITLEAGDASIEVASGYFAFTGQSLFLPVSGSSSRIDDRLVINTTLRGGHTLLTYVSNGMLEFKVAKQDLNWYSKPDPLKIEVCSLSGDLKGSIEIPDDGDASQSKKLGPLQSAIMKIEGLDPGTYRLELKGDTDLLIKSLEINQEKLVVDKKLWATGMSSSYFERGLVSDPLSLYGNNFKSGDLKFFTYHKSGLQQVLITDRVGNKKIEINETGVDFQTVIGPGAYRLTSPNQNLIIESSGYFSFTPASYFQPEKVNVIDLKYDLAWAREHADYIAVNLKDYLSPVKDKDGWTLAAASWNKEDLFIENNQLSFSLKAAHLESKPQIPLPIDSIEITLKTLPVNEKILRMIKR